MWSFGCLVSLFPTRVTQTWKVERTTRIHSSWLHSLLQHVLSIDCVPRSQHRWRWLVFIYRGTRRHMVLYYLRKTELNWQNFEVPPHDKETWHRPSGPTPAVSEKSPHCLEFCFRFDKAWQHLPPQLSPAAVRRRVKQAKRGEYTDEATPRQVIEFCTFIFAFKPEKKWS